MKTVHEVSELAHVSVRTLHHYDQIGLLQPSARSEAGYRLYSDEDLARLQQIMLFRELEFPLADIRAILDSPDYDQGRALEQQIELLELRREHIDNLIDMAKTLKTMGARALSFKPFDTSKLDEYMAAAREAWGKTPQWAEYEQKWAGKTTIPPARRPGRRSPPSRRSSPRTPTTARTRFWRAWAAHTAAVATSRATSTRPQVPVPPSSPPPRLRRTAQERDEPHGMKGGRSSKLTSGLPRYLSSKALRMSS